MRVATVALLSISLIPLASLSPALAEPSAVYVEAPRPADDPVRAAIEARLGQLKTTLRSGSERNWLDGLATLYSVRDFRPIWQRSNGNLDQARKVATEIGRAGDWGLDANQFRLPDLSAPLTDPARAADAEVQLSLAALAYIAHARGHRVDPSQLSKWLDQRPKPVDAVDVAYLADADDPAAALQRQHPQHPQFEKLRRAYLKMRGSETSQAGIGQPGSTRPFQIPVSGPRLKIGLAHPDVAALRTRLGVRTVAVGDAETFDMPLANAVREFQKKAGLKATGIVTDAVREALNDAGDSQAPSSRKGSTGELKKLLVNMERWRWLPDNLGAIHVWNNLPEFETRVVKSGRVIHQERIIIGQTDTQTPIFSGKMRYVVFQPDWGIPNSIKITSLLPKLRNGDPGVIERRDMRVVQNGKTVSSSRIDWSRVDIREVEIKQNPGASNPLGQMKFMFPNKHDVYMHDTPAKGLFNSSVRTFSHGCIRVRNPRVLADLVFNEDRGLASVQVANNFMGSSRPNNKVDLNHEIDVHNTYFTIVANDDGSLRSLSDIYGHDRRIAMALDGTPAAVIARDDPAVRQEQLIKSRRLEAVASRPQPRPEQQQAQRLAPRPLRQWSPFYSLGYN